MPDLVSDNSEATNIVAVNRVFVAEVIGELVVEAQRWVELVVDHFASIPSSSLLFPEDLSP